jgi:biopolymer transport protein ExbD
MSAHAGGAGKSKRRWRLSGHKKAMIDVVRNDINVTPLVDVMLVLLIIFMLMTLVMGRGHDVQLPGAKNYSQEKDKMQPVVTVERDGILYVEKNKLGPISESTLKEMRSQVEAIWAAPKNPDGVGRVYLKADLKATYEKVYPVLEYMNKEMGMSNVDLAIAKGGEEK